MGESVTTRASLLARVRDGRDQAAWRQFVELYGPVVYGFARRAGLQDADAADLTQDVFRAVAAGVKRLEYDPARGRFRNWLYTIARRQTSAFLAARDRAGVAAGGTDNACALAELPAPAAEDEWRRAYEQRVYAWAAERVRGRVAPSTWEAFRLTAVDGLPGEEAARRLGLTVGAVYVAKSRVLTALRAEVRLAGDEGGDP